MSELNLFLFVETFKFIECGSINLILPFSSNLQRSIKFPTSNVYGINREESIKNYCHEQNLKKSNSMLIKIY